MRLLDVLAACPTWLIVIEAWSSTPGSPLCRLGSLLPGPSPALTADMERPVSAFSLLPLLSSHPTLSSSLSGNRFPLFLFSCVADLAVAACSVSAVSLPLSLPCCGSCRWVGRKLWQFSLCRPPSFPFSLPARSWVPFTGRPTMPLCVLLLCVCLYVSLAAAQSQNWLAEPRGVPSPH